MKDEMARTEYPNRQTIRLPHYDYSSAGAYFVTINARKKAALFDRLAGGEVELNEVGEIALEKWIELPARFQHITLDAFIVMPSHVHGVLFIEEHATREADRHVRAQHAAPIRGGRPRVAPGSLGAIVRSYKSAVTKTVNELQGSPGQSVWHRNYYERVIRNERELNEIRHYIANNAVKDR